MGLQQQCLSNVISKTPMFILDLKLTFENHLDNILAKNKPRHLLPRATLITIYKAFVRPYVDYGDV